MVQLHASSPKRYLLPAQRLQDLLNALLRRGYYVLAPTIQSEVVVYDRVESVDELPIGITDEQRPASYRVKRTSSKTFFGYTVGAQSWKRYLYPPHKRLWRAERDSAGSFRLIVQDEDVPAYAFVGVRACDLAAIQRLDQVFLGEQYQDHYYQLCRQKALIIAVNCSHPANNCFCSSVGTGPYVQEGYDLALTEVVSGTRHYFVMEPGSERGTEIILDISCEEATEEHLTQTRQVIAQAQKKISKQLDTAGLQQLLHSSLGSKHWEEVAKRCLSCANCTMVCPTCFCHTIEDTTNLVGTTAERWRKWDSCFHVDFSYIHGGAVRASEASRYRQWMTHKLASWVEQFGVLGCVGCGRCITWCPVGIDIIEEVNSLRRSKNGGVAHSTPKEVSHAETG